jgi:TldD protein
MAERLTIDMLTPQLEANITSVLMKEVRYPGIVFTDLRLQITQKKEAVAENGALRGAGDDYGMSVGVRIIATANGICAPGYDGRPIGAEEFENLLSIIREMIAVANVRARTNACEKATAKIHFGALGSLLWGTRLYHPGWPMQPVRISAEYSQDPANYSLEQIKKTASDVAYLVAENGKGNINYSFVSALTSITREFYANSFGVSIEQDFALSQGLVYAAAGDVGIYDIIGHQCGPEIFDNGINEPLIKFPPFSSFALNILKDAVELSKAPVCPTTDKDVVVVSDPHYNTLLVHEIVGHPTELDRGLKMETAYAGRTWLLKNLNETMVGRQIGSPLLNAYSDPLLPGYGHYLYDHEGVPARRVDHIVNGVFVGFMNSLQTSTIFGGEPNGHFKAIDPQYVPLIRMSSTVFAQGETDPQKLISEVKDGYYLQGHSIPSIAESRENFRISARKVYKIENGKLTTLYRKGGMSADSRYYFMAVDGVGNDFLIYPIANCGKGQPMQPKKLGNGGPTLRSRAKITGGA